jgi:hypothetical protein
VKKNIFTSVLLLSVMLLLTTSLIPSFSAEAADTPPEVITEGPISSSPGPSNTAQAIIRGRVKSAGSYKVIPGFIWGVTGDMRETLSANYMDTPGTFTCEVNFIRQQGRDLAYQAIAKYEVGTETLTAYGKVVTMRPGGSIPQVTTLDSSISAESLLLRASRMYTYDPVPGYCFEYGLTTEYGSSTPLQTLTNSVNRYSAEIAGIEPGVYHYRACADTGRGWSVYGDDMVVDYRIPHTISAGTPSNVTSSSANLDGYLTSMGNSRSVSAYFEYGLTTDYGKTTPPQTLKTFGPFGAVLSGLTPGATYHYRAASDGGGNGKVYSQDFTFTTEAPPPPPPATSTPPTTTAPPLVTSAPPAATTVVTIPPPATDFVKVPPLVSTAGASAVGIDSVTLEGSIVSMGDAASVTVYFEYGAGTGTALTTDAKTLSAPGAFSAQVSALSPGTTYSYRVKANPGLGFSTIEGKTNSFTTASQPPAPTVTNIFTLGPISTVTTYAATVPVTPTPLGGPARTNSLLWPVIGFGALAALAVVFLIIRSRGR